MPEHKPEDIRDRTFNFALRIIELSHQLPSTGASGVVAKQLVRSGTSIGANVGEATAASSKADFAYRMNVALREARETDYWLRIVEASKLVDSSRSSPLLKEAVEIMNILGAIVSSARGKRKS